MNSYTSQHEHFALTYRMMMMITLQSDRPS